MNTAKFNNNCTGAISWRLLSVVTLLLVVAGLAYHFVPVPDAKNGDAQPVGVVTQLGGEVNMIRKNSYYAVSTGVSVYIKDIIITGKDASLQMDMVDGTILRLGDNSRIVLSDYKVDDKKKVVGAMVNVLSGWLRFAVAKLQKKASYNFNTPVMMVGVRGTEGIIHAGNKESDLFLQEGRVRVQRSYGSNDAVKGRDVRGGQYVNRQRGRAFYQASKAPDAFQRRIPRSLNRYERMLRRAHLLERRNIDPRFVRRVEQRDVDGLIERHPYMQRRFQRRFKGYQFRRDRDAAGPGREERGGKMDWERWVDGPGGRKGRGDRRGRGSKMDRRGRGSKMDRRDGRKEWDGGKEWEDGTGRGGRRSSGKFRPPTGRRYPTEQHPGEDYPRGGYPRGDYPRGDYPRGDYPRGGYPAESRPIERFHTKPVRVRRYRRVKRKPTLKKHAVKKGGTRKPATTIKPTDTSPTYIKR